VTFNWSVPEDRPIEPVDPRGEVVVYQNRYITVRDDRVRISYRPDEPDLRYLTIVERDNRPGVAIFATCDDLVALVLVYRYPRAAWEWGIPRGFAESSDPSRTARIELRQEIGAEPSRTQPLGYLTANSGLLAGTTALFHAEFDTPVSAPTDQEVREVRWVTVPQLAQAIAEEHVIDSFTLSAIAKAVARGIIQMPAVIS
jgi:hypothetical protein